jgi:methionyl-tRNA formyltransferase
MRVLFLGPSPSPIIETLQECGCRVISQEGIVTKEYLEKYEIEYALSYRYRHIVKKPVLEYFDRRIINLHISFLPWNRGADPNLWSFLDDTPKGVTIHIMDEGIDTGDILIQKEVDYDENDTLQTSYQRLSSTIETLFRLYCPDIIEEKIKPHLQTGSGSYHKTTDKNAYLHLLSHGWDTPVKNLIGKAK